MSHELLDDDPGSIALFWTILMLSRGRMVFAMDAAVVRELFSATLDFDVMVDNLEKANLIETKAEH